LFAEIADKAQLDGDYLIWDLQTDLWQSYTAGKYLSLSKTGRATSPADLKDFWYFYNNYWNKWRLWLLP
jgi:hypothetical protein